MTVLRTAVLNMNEGRKAIRKREPGLYVGGATVPFGCTVENGHLIVGQALIELVATIRAGRAAGVSWAAIGRPLGLLTHQVKRRLDAAERLCI